MKKPYVFAVSGIKNSGKTTFSTKLIHTLSTRGFKIAAIKHDGHDFNTDMEGTDSYRLQQAGAYGTAVFSSKKFMIVKEADHISEKALMQLFPEADFILLEGFKHSTYPKFELVRRGVSTEPVCAPETLIALVTDQHINIEGVPSFGLDEIDAAADYLLCWIVQRG